MSEMYKDDLGSLMSLRRLPARKVEKPVNFSFIAPEAQTVSLAGDFNGWDPEATPMRRMPDGGWTAQVTLPHGHHRYLFVVDGEAMLDPRANGTSTDENDYTFSLIAVS